MPIARTLVLGIAVLTALTGCASLMTSGPSDLGASGDGAALSSPARVERQASDCRNRGVYNRATNLCVSEGP